MAPAGVLWTAGRSSGGLLGREREEWRGEGAAGSKRRGELGQGRNAGWRPVSGRWRALARAGGSGPFKASQGRRGRRVGVSVAHVIEGRPRSAARVGARLGSFGATAAS